MRGQPGVEQTVIFGDSLHVSGTDAAALARTVSATAATNGLHAETIDTGLEDVFIYMMSRSSDNFGGQAMSRNTVFSLARWWSIVRKEFLQLRRDRVTFAMIVGVPIIQMALFGYAINTDPKHLDTADYQRRQHQHHPQFSVGHEEFLLLQVRGRVAQPSRRPRSAHRRARCCSWSRFPLDSPASFCATSGLRC